MIPETRTLIFDPPIALDSGPNRGPFTTLDLAEPLAVEMQTANGLVRNGINLENKYLRDAALISAVSKRVGEAWPVQAIDRIPDGKLTEAANFLLSFQEDAHLKALSANAGEMSGDAEVDGYSPGPTLTLTFDPPVEILTGPQKGTAYGTLELAEPLGGEMRVANGQVRAGVNHENQYGRGFTLISLVSKRLGSPWPVAAVQAMPDGRFTEAMNFLMGFQERAHLRSMQAATSHAVRAGDQTTDD